MTREELDRLWVDTQLRSSRRLAGVLQVILTTAASVAFIIALSAWEASRPRG